MGPISHQDGTRQTWNGEDDTLLSETYDSVEFRPGPSLNVIIGPNGTGKSTIVCAICLGLAGKPSLLGRALLPMEYIKHGCSRAMIEIELYNPSGDNYIIRRDILKDNSSKWSVNGRNAILRNVEATVSNLNIQVGNLCQFLPQDKVADFAKMSQQELLENTEKAVGPPEMYEQHQALKNAREKERDLELLATRVKEQLEQEQSLNSRLEQDVKNYQQREKHLNRVNQLKMKRPWAEYEEKRKEHEAAKELKVALGEQIRDARKKNSPLQRQLEAADKRIKEVDAKMKKLGDAVKEQARCATQCHKNLEAQNDQVQEHQEELNVKRQEENTRKKKIRDLSGQIQSIEGDLANMEEEDVQPKLDELNQEMMQLNRHISQHNQKHETAKMSHNNVKREITILQSELKELQDVGNRRLEKLRQQHKDTYNAIQWLRANKHLFKGDIYEPMMLIIDVKDPNKAKYLENTISANDMRAFVCERNDDMKKFMDTIRSEQKLKVNVIVAPSEPAASYKARAPIEQLRRYGFQDYLKDLFDCPETVMRYLCRNYYVHDIPVGNAQTKSNVESVINRNPQLRNFFTENHKYNIKKSKYSNATSSRCMELRRPTMLDMKFDSAREQEVMKEIGAKQVNMKKLETEWRNMDKSQKEMESRMDLLRNNKKELTNKRNLRRNLQQKISMKKDTLMRVESEAIDLDQEEVMMKQKITGILSRKCKLLKELQEYTQKCLKLSEEKVRQSMIYASTLQEKQTFEEQLREQSYNLRTLERDFEKQKDTTKVLKETAMRLFNVAKQANNLTDSQELPADVKKVFELLPSTLEKIDAAIHEEQARADCTFQTDHCVVLEFKQREKRIGNLHSDVTKRDAELLNHRQTIEETKLKWLEPLKELISRINKNFAYFFNCLKCAGEVDLNIPDNPEDYEKYGMRIKVLFRQSEQLRELTPHHQSGGERSVSTVLYMMALQELTRVPFRCVDEINQGMDPQNERKVFELVVQTACENSTSQYFLLTPKLLPDLHYTDNMTILCVYNGPYMINHTDWKLAKFINRGQRYE